MAWEGECVSGTAELEPSGSGTKVTIKAKVREAQAEEASAPAPLHRSQVVPDLEAWNQSAAEIENHSRWQTSQAQRAAERAAKRAARESKGGLARRLFRGRRSEPNAEPVVRPGPLPEPTPPEPREPSTVNEESARAVLHSALDNLGAARHRPVSRS